MGTDDEGDASSAGDLAIAPHPTLGGAVESIFCLLEEAGLGRWRLVTGAGDVVQGFTLAVPGDDGHPRMEPDPAAPAPRRSDPASQRFLADAARIVATIVAADRHTVRIEEQAANAVRASSTDPLTGVANAGAWWRRLGRQAEACDAQGVEALVAVVDLDELKQVNDQHGHLAGDLLLRTTAEALVQAVRGHDQVARVGGDEFGVLVVDPDPPPPEALAERLERALADVGVVASVGAAKYCPGGRINDTYHLADRAMYRAKAARRDAR